MSFLDLQMVDHLQFLLLGLTGTPVSTYQIHSNTATMHLNADMKQIGRLERAYLIKVILPPNQRNFVFHDANLCSIFSIIGFHKTLKGEPRLKQSSNRMQEENQIYTPWLASPLSCKSLVLIWTFEKIDLETWIASKQEEWL